MSNRQVTTTRQRILSSRDAWSDVSMWSFREMTQRWGMRVRPIHISFMEMWPNLIAS